MERQGRSSRSSTYSYGIKVGSLKGEGESERQGKGEPLEEAVPIIHGTVEHRGVKPAPVCLRGKPARVRRFRCLLFRLPQIRFVSGATRCSDYQAGKKKRKKKGRRGIYRGWAATNQF